MRWLFLNIETGFTFFQWKFIFFACRGLDHVGKWKYEENKFYLSRIIIWSLLLGELLSLDFQDNSAIPAGCGGPLGFHCRFFFEMVRIMRIIAIETAIKLYTFTYIYTNRILNNK
jgi:hypothetical protein